MSGDKTLSIENTPKIVHLKSYVNRNKFRKIKEMRGENKLN